MAMEKNRIPLDDGALDTVFGGQNDGTRGDPVEVGKWYLLRDGSATRTGGSGDGPSYCDHFHCVEDMGDGTFRFEVYKVTDFGPGGPNKCTRMPDRIKQPIGFIESCPLSL